jgi:Ca2+-binding EF-hand superfamily protein
LLDEDKNGSVDKREFIDGLFTMMNHTISQQDLAIVFDALDLNNDHFLSVNEFGLYLQGAKIQKD